MLCARYLCGRCTMEYVMIKLYEKGVFLSENNELLTEEHCSGHIEKITRKRDYRLVDSVGTQYVGRYEQA